MTEKTISNPDLTSPEFLEAAFAEAKLAASRAYVPYSHFPVGAAVVTVRGDLIPGCNVENSSYPLCNCAERTAMFAAIAQGYAKEELKGIVLFTPTDSITTPCGACRQVMVELLGPDGFVVMTCRNESLTRKTSVKELLPDSFSL